MNLMAWYIFAGERFKNHVISQHETANVLECSQYCLRKSYCRSFNFKVKRRTHQSDLKNCQLNNATKRTHPQNSFADKNYDYYELLRQVTCSILLIVLELCAAKLKNYPTNLQIDKIVQIATGLLTTLQAFPFLFNCVLSIDTTRQGPVSSRKRIGELRDFEEMFKANSSFQRVQKPENACATK